MSSNIIKKQQTDIRVVDYNPQKFPVSVPAQAQSFVKYYEGKESTFRLNELIAEQTGVKSAQKKILEDHVQVLVLKGLKDVEEKAYREAYELGLDVGRKEAYDTYLNEYKELLGHLDDLVAKLGNLSAELVSHNESKIIKLVYYMAQRLAMDEIENKDEQILGVLQKVIGEVQKEDKVVIKLSQADLEFVTDVRERLGPEFKFLAESKLEVSNELKKGGCLIETNFGVVDASIEERVNRLWSELKLRLPKQNENIGDDEPS